MHFPIVANTLAIWVVLAVLWLSTTEASMSGYLYQDAADTSAGAGELNMNFKQSSIVTSWQ